MTNEQVHDIAENMTNLYESCIEMATDTEGTHYTSVKQIPSKFYEMRNILAMEFGKRRGWTLSRGSNIIYPTQLARGSNYIKCSDYDSYDSSAMDHAYYYRLPRKLPKNSYSRPAAIAVHLYDWPSAYIMDKVVEFCDKYKLRYEVVPVSEFPSWWSMWSLNRTTLIVYTPLARV